jgi:nucleotide-binding universal stress UspA family protein
MKDILIHLRDYREHTPAAVFGVQLAASLGASVTAVYACPHPLHIPPGLGPLRAAAFAEDARDLVRAAVQSRQSFLAWAGSLGAPQTDLLIVQGAASDALAQAATRHDLLVLDCPPDEPGPTWEIPGLLLATGVPCIVLPRREVVPVSRMQRVAIGWNGAPEAMRSIHAALPLLQGRQVLLLRGAEERDAGRGLEWDPPFYIAHYLQRHGIEADEQALAAGHDAGTALLKAARGFGADLLVMGAYGRNRFSEWWFGGATRQVLMRADIPVFFRH